MSRVVPDLFFEGKIIARIWAQGAGVASGAAMSFVAAGRSCADPPCRLARMSGGSSNGEGLSTSSPL